MMWEESYLVTVKAEKTNETLFRLVLKPTDPLAVLLRERGLSPTVLLVSEDTWRLPTHLLAQLTRSSAIS